MILNHLKLSLRRMVRQKGHSLINLLGLTSGMAACLFIFLYVQNEKSFDRFHEAHERTFRVTTTETEDGSTRQMANAFAPLAELLKTGFPGAKEVVRFFPLSASVKNKANNALFQEAAFCFADSNFFEVFDFRLLLGDPATALEKPNSIVLTKAAARRYFGDTDPLGKPLLVEGENELYVTGVAESPPGHSTLQFDFLASWHSARAIMGYPFDDPQRGSWYHPPVFTFVKFPDQTSRTQMADGLPGFVKKYLPERLHDQYEFHLQPLADMHFETLEGDLQPAMKPSMLRVLLAVALLILGIASANYVNISLSVLLRRFREIGMRRVLGAARWQVLQQMATETLLFLFLSLLLAAGVVQFGLPAFNRLVGKNLSLLDSSPLVWTGMVGLTLALGLTVSLLPYFAVSKSRLTEMLKNKLAKATSRQVGGISFKDSFIVFQFAGAVALLLATAIILQQLDFIQNKDLGMEKGKIMVVPNREWSVMNNFEAAKQSFRSVPGVAAVSAISNFPWENGYYDFPSTLKGHGKNLDVNLPTLIVERDFIEAMGMEMSAGRSLSETSQNDSSMVFLVNKAAREQFGIESPGGWRLQMSSIARGDAIEGDVIGVVEDFNMRSLHHRVGPLVLAPAPEVYYLDNFVVRLNTANPEGLKTTIAGLSEQWSQIAPDRPFEYFFLDETFDRLYQRESRLGTLFKWFTGLAMLIACLGMFALAAVLCEQRIKEIGIRKVLGANASGLVGLLSKDFLKLVFVALVVASPLTYFLMENWLQDFAYRIEIQWTVFALAGMVALAAAFLTVCTQSVKAALANPVEALRSD